MSAGDDIEDLVPDFGPPKATDAAPDDDDPPIPGWDDPPPKPAETRKTRQKSADSGATPAQSPALRQPPHSTEAEQSVIGGLMLDNARFRDVAKLVSNRDFYHTKHKLIFDAIETLAAVGKPLDAVTLSSALEDTHRLDKAGGNAYLAELFEATPTSKNVVAYAEIVADKSRLRRIIKKAGAVVEKAFADGGIDDVEQALADLQTTRIRRGNDLVIQTGKELRDMGAPIPWIWRGWLPEAMLTLLAGEKGKGKSTLAMAVTACLTTGKVPWSDVTGEPRRVLYWSGEDDVRIIVGRAEAAGVDFDRFGVVSAITEGDEQRPFEPSQDMPKLLAHMAEAPPDVLILDPLIRILQGKNNSPEDVRRSLDPIASKAEQLGVAIIGIGHFAKASGDRSILDRFLGSQAWTARARMCWAMVSAGERTLFGKPATNIATTKGVMDVELEEVGVKFTSGATDLYTRSLFSNLNTDETLDEVERGAIDEHEEYEQQAKKREKYESEIAAVEEWIWTEPRSGWCTSDDWKSYCEQQGWKTGQGARGKANQIQKAVPLHWRKRRWCIGDVQPED